MSLYAIIFTLPKEDIEILDSFGQHEVEVERGVAEMLKADESGLIKVGASLASKDAFYCDIQKIYTPRGDGKAKISLKKC